MIRWRKIKLYSQLLCYSSAKSDKKVLPKIVFWRGQIIADYQVPCEDKIFCVAVDNWFALCWVNKFCRYGKVHEKWLICSCRVVELFCKGIVHQPDKTVFFLARQETMSFFICCTWIVYSRQKKASKKWKRIKFFCWFLLIVEYKQD